MNNYQDIENIITLLDDRMESGIARIKLQVDDTVQEGETLEAYHHGRCDVASVWAKGNCDV